jgi:hypothetical protein
MNWSMIERRCLLPALFSAIAHRLKDKLQRKIPQLGKVLIHVELQE